MRQWALYHIDPNTNERLACYSGRHMDFHDGDPVLFARQENIKRLLSSYAAGTKQHLARGSRVYLASREGKVELFGADDENLSCFHIVPMDVIPRFDELTDT